MTPQPLAAYGYRLVALDSVDSTNEEAKRLAAGGAADRTVVWAGEQTAGKARRGRGWVSEPGNLYCSILLRPDVAAARAMQIGFVAADGLADALAAALPDGAAVQCKWPNDLLVEGRKVAGILLEASSGGTSDWLVVGVGVNVAHSPAGVEFPATSLRAEGCGDLEAETLLGDFCRRFAAWLETWKSAGFAPVRSAWLRRARGIGETLVVRLERGTLEGTFAGLDGDGALILETSDGRRRITSGDVFFAAA